MKFEIFKYKTVTSTNDKAMELIRERERETGCVYADIQTKGRGSKGKKWVSHIGNLFGSIFFPLEKNYPPFNEFSIVSPIIVSDIIKNFCINKKISFKWPNDIFVDEKKICGILQEVISFNNKKFLIIGIGINILSNPKIVNTYQATNIFHETNNKPTIKQIIDLLTNSYVRFFCDLSSYNFLNYKKKADLMALK